LAALGLSEQKTVVLLWSVSLVFGGIALVGNLYGAETWVLLTSLAVIFLIIFGILLTDVKIYQPATNEDAKPSRALRVNLLFKRRIVEVLIDSMLIGATYVLAYLLRYDWTLTPFLVEQLGSTLPLVLSAKIITLLASGFYRGIWMYIDFQGFLRLLRCVALTSVTSIFLILFVYRFVGFSRTLFAIDFVILVLSMAGARGLLRLLRESVFAFPESGMRVLIIGGGEACRNLLNEIRRNRQWNLRPVAIIDDDPKKKGRKILDVRIVGQRQDIPRVAQEFGIEQIVIAIPSLQPSDLRDIEQLCRQCGIAHVAMQSIEHTLIRKIIPLATGS
jgi:FlaA1/EpsC-like NDP-sugar epimerase